MPYGVDDSVTGAGAAASWSNDNGFNASFATVSDPGSASTVGIYTTESNDHYVASLGYDSDNWGLGLIYTNDDNTTNDNDTSFGAGVYFRPDGFPTISVAFDSLSDASTTDSDDLFIGLEQEWGDLEVT
jgi:predicted porin